ncbi:ABC transporter permease [Nocardioides sp. LHG3406-4]|uniref:ABC transporter permease n=1 Tax=Nocardioides sp. LHG3406-4 TaxID=2804575 RepID=UPI003CF80BBC
MNAVLTPPAAAVLRTEARLFGRELGALFWIVLFPVALVAILGSIPSFREDDPNLGGLSTVDVYVPVSVLLSMIMASIMAMPPVVYAYREGGVLRRLSTTPVGPSAILLAQVLLHAAAVLASSVLVLAVGRVAFGTPLPQSVVGYVLAYVLALVAAFSIGAAIMAVVPNGRVGTAVGTIVFFPAMFTVGVWVPVQSMPGLMRDIVGFTPLSASAEALTDAMAGDFPDLRHLLVVAVWAAVLSLVAVRTFRWE